MPGERQTPTVRLRRLAAELRSLRTSSGLTRDETVERTGINVATLYRIEHARVRPQTRTLRTLLDLYGVDGAHRDDLIALLPAARPGGPAGPVPPLARVGGGGVRCLERRVALRPAPARAGGVGGGRDPRRFPFRPPRRGGAPGPGPDGTAGRAARRPPARAL